jgi:hypothetical protein
MIDHKKPITKLIKKNAIKKEIEINKKKKLCESIIKEYSKTRGESTVVFPTPFNCTYIL